MVGIGWNAAVDVDDGPAALREHPREDGACEFGERHHVQLHLLDEALGGGLREVAHGAEARIVDQVRHARGADLVDEAAAGRTVGQVDGGDPGLHAVASAEVGRDLLQLVAAARREPDVGALGCQPVRIRHAEARRRARYHCPRVTHGRQE
jgi:hypothetical protein